MFLKGKILFKIHNCYFCHKLKKTYNFFYPKIKFQNINYLFWVIKQYKNFKFRKNFLMNSQVTNISILDIKNILIYINNYY